MEEREGIKLGYIYFDGGGVESDWTAPIIGVHTGCTGGSPDKDFMDLYTPIEIIRYYPNAASGLGKFFTVDWEGYTPSILEMHPDKNEIFNVKKVDLFGVCKMMNKVNVVDKEDMTPINELRNAKEAVEPTKEWYKSRIKDLEAELAMTRVLLKVTTEKLVSSGVVAG